jgi:2-keto-4-pentenoate hydratase
MDSMVRLADFFAELRFGQRVVDEVPADIRPADEAAAYAVQDLLVKRLLERHGGHPIGYKIGCTNVVAQQLLNTDAPVFGRLLSSSMCPSPARLRATAFTIMGIEAEFAFEMVRDVPAADGGHTQATIAPYISKVLPAIEIVDHQLTDWSRFDVLSLIADNVIHGAWIPGGGSNTWQAIDLATHVVRVLVNGSEKLTGRGAAVLGHPLNALAWLANELPQWGRSLKAGEFVTTGTCTAVYVAQAGETIQADFGVLGSVEVAFDRD